MTLPPGQKLVAPPAVMVGFPGSGLIAIVRVDAVPAPQPLVAVTEAVWGLSMIPVVDYDLLQSFG